MEGTSKTEGYHIKMNPLPIRKGSSEMNERQRKRILFASAILLIFFIWIVVTVVAFGFSLKKCKNPMVSVNTSARRSNKSGLPENMKHVAQKDEVRH